MALGSLALQAACGLCGNTDDVRVTSPDGKHVAHSYLYDCGATTGYTTIVDLEASGYSRGGNAYSAEGAYDLTLRWASPDELHIECRGCPPRHPTAPRIDGIAITVISAARDSVVVPRLSTVPECPSFTDLGKQVDARVETIMALEPGLPLKAFTAEFASPALNFWDNVGWERETVFSVAATDGNAQVSDELVCRFDRAQRFRSCKRECCRSTTRTITETQYKSLAIGSTQSEVERRLCSPSDSEADPKNSKRLVTYYHIDLPIGHHDEGSDGAAGVRRRQAVVEANEPILLSVKCRVR